MASLTEIQIRRATEPPAERFLSTGPFEYARRHATNAGCDLAIPNGPGIGNILCFTPLVEALARKLGRRLRLLTAPLDPLVGKPSSMPPYPIWDNNPYVAEIVNADELDPRIMCEVNREQDNMCQFGHIIENICSVFGLVPRRLQPSLYLRSEERAAALDLLAQLPRPVVGIHAGGTSSSLPDSPWFLERWKELCTALEGEVSFVQTAQPGFDQKDLGVFCPALDLRGSMSVIWACDLFIGFDSSPAHIATAFGRPAIILWDVRRKSIIEDRHYLGYAPASMLRWSYPQNRNFMILGEKDDDLLPHCIESIRSAARSFDHQR